VSSPTRAFTTLHLHILSEDKEPDLETTLPMLLQELARCGDLDSLKQLIAAVEGGAVARCKGTDTRTRDQGIRRDMQLLNLMLRCLSKLDVDQAVRKAAALHDDGIVIEAATYSQLAAKSLNAGNFAQAEKILEHRDYL
jgi:hypothetical protein